MARNARVGVLLLLVVVLAVVAGRSWQAARESGALASGRVILIVVDTLRADRLGAYGSTAGLTPRLDAFAAESVLFERFHADSPWTTPSFASLLTGMRPANHLAGLRWEAHGLPSPDAALPFAGIRPDVATLAERLGLVPSGAIVSNSSLHADFGFRRGFGWFDYVGTMADRPAPEVSQRAQAWLQQQSGDFFAMVHYMDTHGPYAPPPAYRQRLVTEDSGRVGPTFDGFEAVRSGAFVPTEAEQRYIAQLYDAEVAAFDAQFGAMVDWLGAHGFLQDTWVIVTSDHGEELFDHGGVDHGDRFEEEVSAVPLLVRGPGGSWHPGRRVAWPATTADVFSTVLGVFGVPAGDVDGVDLRPVVEGAAPDRLVGLEFRLRGKEQKAVFDGRYKLIGDEQDRWLYDLDEDPKEQRPLRGEHPERARMEAAWRGFWAAPEGFAEGAAASAGAVPDDVVEALKAIGYIE
jgi:arylsulfatase A-like enzyme